MCKGVDFRVSGVRHLCTDKPSAGEIYVPRLELIQRPKGSDRSQRKAVKVVLNLQRNAVCLDLIFGIEVLIVCVGEGSVTNKVAA